MREAERQKTEKSSSEAAGSADGNGKTDIFVKLVEKAVGDDFVGTVRGADGRRIAFATREPDRGEKVAGRYVEPIIAASREAGIRIGVMPFPVDGKLVYEVAVRRQFEA